MKKGRKKTFRGKVIEASESISNKIFNSKKLNSIIKISIENLSQEDFARIAFSKSVLVIIK